MSGIPIKILAINPMDQTYGSTHRMRKLVYGLVADARFRVEYVESNTDLSGAVNVRQGNSLSGFLKGNFMRTYIALTKEYDILFIQTITPLTIFPILAAKLLKRKIVVDWDDLSWVLQKNKTRACMVRFCEENFLGLADMVTVPSLHLRDYGRKYRKNGIEYLPHGIDLDLFSPRKHTGLSVRERFGIDKDAKVLGFLASFTTGGVGDLDLIFSAIKKIMARHPGLKFLIIGGGPLFETYKAMAERMQLYGAYFTGWLPQESIPGHIAAIDIGLIFMRDNVANKYKTSLKVAEYLAMHKMVVGHIVGETLDRFGRFCRMSGGDEASFLATIEEAIDEDARSLDWKAVDSFLQSNYSWRSSVNILGERVAGLI